MAERKVTSKYFPPDFDPSAIEGRVKKPKKDGLKSIPVRLMAPFSMKCTNCGEYIYKGRKFNARKETLDEKYLGVTLYRFYIRCTDCKHEITFRTDPKNMDYMCEKGARRNYEVWRDNDDDKFKDETQEETLDRLERELGEEQEQQERDKMAELEDKMQDSKREMQIADALDEIRTRNARIERKEATDDKVAVVETVPEVDDEEARFEAEIAELARKAFRDEEGNLVKRLNPEDEARLNRPITPPPPEADGFDWGKPIRRKREKKKVPWKVVRPSDAAAKKSSN